MDKNLISCLILEKNLDSGLSTRLKSEGSIAFKEMITESSTSEAIRVLSNKNIDLFMIDESFDIFENLIILKTIHKQKFKGKVIFLSSSVNHLHSEVYLQLNASAHISTNESIDFVCSCIENVMKGYVLFSTDNKPAKLKSKFNIDELIVLLLLFQNKSTYFISKILDIEESLVNQMKLRLLTQYNIKSVSEL